jgi:hypothetical protein
MKLITVLLIFLIFILSNELLKCDQKLVSNQKLKFDQSIYFLLGYPAGANAENFFHIYKKYVGGSNDIIKTTPIIGFGTKFRIHDNFRIGLLGYFYQSSFIEWYSQKIYPTPESVLRWVNEEITINSSPLFFTFEFDPYLKSQFHTYFGLGLGCDFGKINWKENVYITVPEDKRKGGTLVNESTYSFTSRAYVGMELGFDKKTRRYLLGGLIFEAAYVYDSRQTAMFEKLYDQFYVKHEEFLKKYSMVPGIFELSMSVSLVFE